jgi:hypothetical protein
VTFLHLQQPPGLDQFGTPPGVDWVATQQRLDLAAGTRCGRTELGDRAPSANDREMRALMLYSVEDVGEPSSGLGSGYVGHVIRLSDSFPPCSAPNGHSALFGGVFWAVLQPHRFGDLA